MGKETYIEWTDATFNPWEGCTKVSPGCKNCYALARNMRFHGGSNWGKGAPRRRTGKDTWREPRRMNLRAAQAVNDFEGHSALHGGKPHYDSPRRPRIFCASLADWLDPEVPVEWLRDLLELVRTSTFLDWQLLTKRPELWAERLEAAQDWDFDHGNRELAGWLSDWRKHGRAPANVWVGTSVENQAMADLRIPQLSLIPARVRFLSIEPLLEAVDLSYPKSIFPNGVPHCCSGFECACHGRPTEPPLVEAVNWVIVGGESGPDRRDCGVEAITSVAIECGAAGVPVFVKQDCAPKAGTQGRISAPIWSLKQFPTSA